MAVIYIEYTDDAKKEMLFWIKSENKAILKRIKLLIKDINQNPFNGIEKPGATCKL